MASESKARLILKKSTLEYLKNFGDDIAEIIESTDLNKEYGMLAYLGWDGMTRDDIENIIDVLSDLSCEEMSYRFSVIGENLENIEEYAYTKDEDEKLFIPFPSIIRDFDDKEIENQMQYFVNLEKNSQEEIEI